MGSCLGGVFTGKAGISYQYFFLRQQNFYVRRVKEIESGRFFVNYCLYSFLKAKGYYIMQYKRYRTSTPGRIAVTFNHFFCLCETFIFVGLLYVFRAKLLWYPKMVFARLGL